MKKTKYQYKILKNTQLPQCLRIESTNDKINLKIEIDIPRISLEMRKQDLITEETIRNYKRPAHQQRDCMGR